MNLKIRRRVSNTDLNTDSLSEPARFASIYRNALKMLRRLSLRKHVWFNSLTEIERGILNLTIKVVDQMRSQLLVNTIKQLVSKLCSALTAGYTYRFEVAGRPVASRLSEAAYSWGNKAALLWKYDSSYVQCVGMNMLSSWFRSSI